VEIAVSKRPTANQAKADLPGKNFAVNGKTGWWCWRKAWCSIIGLAMATCVWSQGSPLPTTFGTAILCLDDLAPGYFYNTMRQYQRPYKIENGAYWFKSSGELFGAPLTEVFISDGSSRYDFVGAVSSLSPVELAEVVSANAPVGGGFTRLSRTERYSIFVSRIGSEIAYQGKKGKIFCRRDRIRLTN
jgi:hypothetical protein